MTTKIGLISDPHATVAPLAEALAIFRREGVAQVFCAGDIGGYGNELDETVALLQRHGVRAIRGNHELWALEQDEFPGSSTSRDYFAALPAALALTIEGISLYMVHAEPPDRVSRGLRLFDQHGTVIPQTCAAWQQRLAGFDHEVLILGHTHQVYAVQLGRTLVINPGSCRYNHSCAILTLPQLQLEWFSLGGQVIETVWNWGANEAKG